MPPFVLSLLAQGLGLIGNAVLAKGKDVIEQKLGVNLEESLQTDEGKQKLLQLQVDHEEFLINSAIENRKIDLDLYKVDAADRSDARGMNTRIEESNNASWMAKNIVPVLALLVVVGGGTMIWASPDTDTKMAAISIVTLVLGFYFGTSSSSRSKDATISNLSQSSGVSK